MGGAGDGVPGTLTGNERGFAGTVSRRRAKVFSMTMSPKALALDPAPLIGEDDPVWRAAMAAPVEDTPDTEEERAAIEEVRRSGFRSVPGSAVSAEIARRAREES